MACSPKSVNSSSSALSPVLGALNDLIERLWRHVKQQVLYSRYYDSFPKFKTAIMDCINGSQSQDKKSLHSLMSLKFQIIEESQILNE
jgi:hypothetical protein